MRKYIHFSVAIIILILLILLFSRFSGGSSFDVKGILRDVELGYSGLQSRAVVYLFGGGDANMAFRDARPVISMPGKPDFTVWFSMMSLVGIFFVAGLWFLKRSPRRALVMFLSTIAGFFVFHTLLLGLLVWTGIVNNNVQYLLLNLFPGLGMIAMVLIIFRSGSPVAVYGWLLNRSGIPRKALEVRVMILFLVLLGKLLLNFLNQEFHFRAIVAEGWMFDMIIFPSHWITQVLGLHTWIVDNYLWSDRTYVFVAYSCLGVYAMLLFALFVIMLGGSWKHKAWFVPAGILVIFIINIIRVSMLFMYYHHHHGENVLGIDTHDMFNTAAYVAIFVLWVVWIQRFDGLNFNNYYRTPFTL